jgi:hypothetical protein
MRRVSLISVPFFHFFLSVRLIEKRLVFLHITLFFYRQVCFISNDLVGVLVNIIYNLFTPLYSWNTAKVGVKHQSINQSINWFSWYVKIANFTINFFFTCCRNMRVFVIHVYFRYFLIFLSFLEQINYYWTCSPVLYPVIWLTISENGESPLFEL